jgi:hypothetical protein
MLAMMMRVGESVVQVVRTTVGGVDDGGDVDVDDDTLLDVDM